MRDHSRMEHSACMSVHNGRPNLTKIGFHKAVKQKYPTYSATLYATVGPHVVSIFLNSEAHTGKRKKPAWNIERTTYTGQFDRIETKIWGHQILAKSVVRTYKLL